jgi:hypothetical protein
MPYAIHRLKDGKWYTGTVDYQANFGNGGQAAHFQFEEDAEKRKEGLEAFLDSDKYEIIPVRSKEKS